MIYTVSITKKGQMTLPKRVRDDLGISVPGKVAVKTTPEGVVVVDSVKSFQEIRAALGKPKGRGTKGWTEREKIIIPQVMKSRKYRQYVKDTN